MVGHRSSGGSIIATAVLAVVCLSLASAAPAAPHSVAAARTVTISPRGPVPRSATIAVGTTVRWVNASPRTRRITADRRTFPAFSLAVGTSHSYRFDAVGRYPYRIDGRFPGTIVVVAGGSAPGSASGRTGGRSSCKAVCDFHYTVAIEGVRTYKDTATSSKPALAGRTELYLAWTGQIPDVKVTVFTSGKGQINGGGKGTAQATIRFIESRALWGGPCQGNAAARIPISLELGAGPPHARPFFSLSVEEAGGKNFFAEAVKPAMGRACPGGAVIPAGLVSPGPATTSLSLGDIPGPYGTTWFVSTSSYLRIGVERPNGSFAEAPFSLIRNGEPFALVRRLYTRTGEGCTPGDPCATTDIMQYSLTFTPIKRD